MDFRDVEHAIRQAGTRRPAAVIARGNVRASIWANPTTWGDVEWRISFARFYARPRDSGYSHSFEPSDLRDLIQVTFQAKRWVAKAEKRIRRRRWLLGWI